MTDKRFFPLVEERRWREGNRNQLTIGATLVF